MHYSYSAFKVFCVHSAGPSRGVRYGSRQRGAHHQEQLATKVAGATEGAVSSGAETAAVVQCRHTGD